MANFSISPGVTLNEIDNTFLTGQPVKAGAAIIGPTVKGPVETPIMVTSYSDYVNRFGDSFESGSQAHSFFTSTAAFSYFNNGGEKLLVTRVVSGSYTPADSTAVRGVANAADVFDLETLSKGVIANSGILTEFDTANAFSLPSGSKDNVRFNIVTSNTGSGTFSLVVRQGNDNDNQQQILETFNNVNLDPFSERYISKVVGDQKLEYDSSTNQMVVNKFVLLIDYYLLL